MNHTVRIQSLWGLGDNIYMRPIVRAIAQSSTVYTDTPWPELYQDIKNVRFYYTKRLLRTQLKNIARQEKAIWSILPNKIDQILKPSYSFTKGTLFTELRKTMCFENINLTLDLPEFPRKNTNKIAVIRPVTIRKEWLNSARNPLPEYIDEIAGQLLARGYHVICVADIDDINERVHGCMPRATEHILGGLPIKDLLGLIQSASLVVGGVGWILPAAIAANVPALIVYGGQGAHNAPQRLIEPHWRHKVHNLVPDKFHNCVDMRCTKCDKTIARFSEKVHDYLKNLETGA